MGSVHAYQTKAGKRYLVRYFKPDMSQGAKRGFLTKRAAESYLSQVDIAITQQQYVDPGDGRITIGELGGIWLEDQRAVLKPSSMHPLQSTWRVHVEPRWGSVRASDIRYSNVRSWVTEPSEKRGATTVIRAYGILASILDVAVRDRRLGENPIRGMKLPRKQPKRRVYLSHRNVEHLAAEAGHPDLILFLAYTGLRWGEATGLRARDVDPLRRRVHVQENAVMVNGAVHTGTPKTHASRSVPYPDFLDPAIRINLRGKAPHQLLFGSGDEHLRLPNSQNGWFAAAVRRAQQVDPDFPKVTPHDLRHTAASLAISAGANVKAVQRMLGHASAAMTLDTYADLFDDDLDYVAEALSRARNSQRIVTVAEHSDAEHRESGPAGYRAPSLGRRELGR
ncbi:site-specific integrase [Microbacterium sp. ARD31]|uniref:tyrosine-type recombinase/integrase n=1 Tax=Microbacterium sp. ARD31 TaxID=2962576 RepID=UPI002881268E|nr:site-specific integrase [Microbacterium sp. ARD31]MDT0186044.1 site-specific integrase [Microbacterium sp. ARD31]